MKVLYTMFKCFKIMVIYLCSLLSCLDWGETTNVGPTVIVIII